MEEYKGGHLVCVDPYMDCYEFPGTRMPDLLMAVQVLAPYHGRVRILETTSTQAADEFPWWLKPHIGFVYLDGMHDYESVRADIRAWWPLLNKDNSLLAGHDFDDEHPGVKQAVTEFASLHDLTINVTEDVPHSWYIWKARQ
jgi:hypothetical protein